MFLWVRVDFSSVFCRKQAVHRRGQTSIRMTSIAVKNVLSRAALSSSRGAITRVIASSRITEFTPLAYQQQRTYFSKEESKSVYEYGAHRSDAEARIDEIPVVMVDGPVALCDGGGGALGHPLDYVYLPNPEGKPVACKYCGVRYQMKMH